MIWLDGIGWLPAQRLRVDFFDEYKRLEDSPIAAALNAARVGLVNRYSSGDVLDVGIGAGMFIRSLGLDRAWGADVDRNGIAWLRKAGRLWTGQPVESVTFWDSLEHIPDPTGYLAAAVEFVFVSCPVFDSKDSAMRSKHYKPGEHLWYFTPEGLGRMMRRHGFHMIEQNDMEVRIGRQEIGTFAFQRVGS